MASTVQTTRFTYKKAPSVNHLIPIYISSTQVRIKSRSYLEEPLQPPHLERALREQHAELEHAPPLDPTVCAFGGVSVDAFTDHDVGLLVFHLGEFFGELAD